jgi:hypothetical protein
MLVLIPKMEKKLSPETAESLDRIQEIRGWSLSRDSDRAMTYFVIFLSYQISG